MTQPCHKQASPRHGFVFDKVPTVKGSMYGGSITIYKSPHSYGCVLDCVFEMALDVSCANGISAEMAVGEVVQLEGWRILPTHKKRIIQRIEE